ncbi:hypothetical protein CAEBREN_15719 [Caenorhabditis brenneri]|uniref:Uncharacterized protein n=1 Tax=Caenorhabditis brenneri TaxID=135651 RepID=G0N4P0_CAEBE|nr:hypothetical protein CAEBREN_15719 [Caenorhabditis brenneri]
MSDGIIEKKVDEATTSSDPIIMNSVPKNSTTTTTTLANPTITKPAKTEKTEMDRTMDRRDRDENHSNYYIAEGSEQPLPELPTGFIPQRRIKIVRVTAEFCSDLINKIPLRGFENEKRGLRTLCFFKH